jgi:glycosyltransferase involved in cell wall biosynthesis
MPTLEDAKDVTMGKDGDTFVFYSIFQWIERKNPLGLLMAYLTEFNADDNVALVLKTYRINPSRTEQEIIKKEIRGLKETLRLGNWPLVQFFGDLYPTEVIKGFHKRGDCMVLPHRGEGFGIPHAEAMSYGNPVIATRYGGNLEFMTDENSYLVNYQEAPVSGMIFGNYHGHMVWADPDIMDLRHQMREVFTHREKARERGLLGRETIRQNYSHEVVGQTMVERLREIEKSL